MRTLLSALLGVLLCIPGTQAQHNVIDHTCIDLNAIPDHYIEAARQNLHIYFGHRSHGSQVTAGGMTSIMNYSPEYASKYSYNQSGSGGALRIYEPENFPPEDNWESDVRNYLNNNPGCNTVLWGWSFSVVSNGHLPGDEMGVWSAEQYTAALDGLRADYPAVNFVVTTPIAYSRRPDDFTREDLFDRGTFLADSILRKYAFDNNLWLYDFYALSTHDPDGNNYGSRAADETMDDQRRPLDDASYAEYITHNARNWGNDWITANPGAENSLMSADAICVSCAHSDGIGDNYRGPTANSRLQCVMKGKAAWHLWARLAGWDGSNQVIPVSSITFAGNVNTITTDNGTLQLSASVLPANATNKTLLWSVQNGTGQATVSAAGLVTAVANGTVTVTASATDGSGVSGSFAITISNQVIPVSSITITSAGNVNTITTDNGTLQLSASVLPANPTNKIVTWSVQNGTGQASVNSSGLVTAIANGTVTIRATATDGSGISDTFLITISNQSVPVSTINITSAGSATTISTAGGSLQLTAEVLPANATNKVVTWSVQNGTGQASVNSSGLVTAIANGTVTIRATATDGSGISDTFLITISNQSVPVSTISITSAGSATTITTTGGSLQLTAEVLPANATNKVVAWSVQNGTGQASVNSSGLVTAIANGTVTIRATTTDGSGISDTFLITISNQSVPVSTINITSAGSATTITTNGGSLQLTAEVLPANATNKIVTWSVQNGTGQASVNSSGLVTAIANGTVTIRATATDGSGISDTFLITISNQSVPVSTINITSAGSATTITTTGGSLQLTAEVLPANATNKIVTWSVQNGTGQASVNSTGLVTAIANGTVTIRATATDGSGISDTFLITISNQSVPVSTINITSAGSATTISTAGGSLQLTAEVLPANATNKIVTWSVQNGTGQASVNSSGLVTAIANGTVTIRATATDGSGISNTFLITISNQSVPVSTINLTSAGSATTITTTGGSLQLTAEVLPANATNKIVTWSVQNGTGQASVNSSGLVTAIANGTVTIRATATDGSGISNTFLITISNQSVPVSTINLTSAGSATTITTTGGSLQLTAEVLPANATNKIVTWSVQNGTGQASVNSTGLVTAIANGTVTIVASAIDGSDVSSFFNLFISNQVYIPVQSVIVSSENGANVIESSQGQLQLIAEILPVNASNQKVNWKAVNVTGEGTISESGLVTAVSDGIIYANATSSENEAISDYFILTISGQIININEQNTTDFSFTINANELKIFNISTKGKLWIIDIFGRVILTHDFIDGSVIRIPDVTKGIYFFHILLNEKQIVNKKVYLP